MEQDRTSHVEESSLTPFLIPHPSHVCQAEPLSVKLQNGNPLAEKTHNEVNGNHTWLHFKTNFATKHAAKGNANNRISPDLLQEKKDFSRYMQNGGIKRTFSEPSLYALHQNKKLKQDEEAKEEKQTSLDNSDQPDVSNSCSKNDFAGFGEEKNAVSVLIQSSRYNSGASETPHVPQVQNDLESENINCHNGDTVLLYKNKAVPIPNGAIVSASSMENMRGELLEKTLSQYNPDHVSIAMQNTTSLRNAINTRAANELVCGVPHSSHTSGQISSLQTSNSELPQVLTAVATEVHCTENSNKTPILPACYTFQNPEQQLPQQSSEGAHQSPSEDTDAPGNIEQGPSQNFSLPSQDFSLNPSNSLEAPNQSSESLAEPAEENGALFQQHSMFKKDSFSPPPVAASPPPSEISNILSIGVTEGHNSYSAQSEEVNLGKEKNGEQQQQGKLVTEMTGLLQQALSTQQGLQEDVQISKQMGSETDLACTVMSSGIMQQYPEEMKPNLEPQVQDSGILRSRKEMQQHYQHVLGHMNQETLADNEKGTVKEHQMQPAQSHSQAPWAGMTPPQFYSTESPHKSNHVLLRTMLQLQSNSSEQTHPKQYSGSPDISKGLSGQPCQQNIMQYEQMPALYKSEATQLAPPLTADQQMQFRKHSPQPTQIDPPLKPHEQQQNTKHFHFQTPAEHCTDQSLEAQLKPQHLCSSPMENEQFLQSHILQQMLQSQPTQLPQSTQLTLNPQQQTVQRKTRETPQAFPHSNSKQEQQLGGTSLHQLKLEECYETTNNYFKSAEFSGQNSQTRPEQVSSVNNEDPLYNHAFKANTVMKHSYPNNVHLASEKKEPAMNSELFMENLTHDLQRMQYYPNSGTPKQDVPQCFQEQKSQLPQTSAVQLPFQQTQGYHSLNSNMCSQQQRYSPYSPQVPSHTLDPRGCHLPSQPHRDFQKHAALRWHILNKQEQHFNQNKSEMCANMGNKPIKAEAGSKPSVCQRPLPAENKMWKKTIKQEVQHFGCENTQQKSIIETMEQQLKQIQVKTLFDHKSLTIKSPKHVKVETAGPITILSRNSTAADFSNHTASFDQQAIQSNEKTPTKTTAGTVLNHFLESPSKLFDTPVKNLLDTPVKTQYDFPSCSCVGE